jgi:hypothetical protein
MVEIALSKIHIKAAAAMDSTTNRQTPDWRIYFEASVPATK